MSLIPEHASDVEMLEATWLAITGRSFSPLDLDQLERWRCRGLPLDVIAAGVRDAFETKAYDTRPGEPPLRALRQCAPAVERRFAAWRRLTLGRGSR